MASSSDSSVSVPPGTGRRGLISCLHSLNCRDEDEPLLHDDDLQQAMYELIVGFYDEAFARLRLPCEAMPDLYGLLSNAGICLGLLDPVSNIILNTLALLNPEPQPPKHTDTSSDDDDDDSDSDNDDSDDNDDDDDDDANSNRGGSRRKRRRHGFNPWHQVARRSAHSLMAFLVAYFGCLKEAQAIRYLYRAKANLLLAVMLVQHDLYHAEPLDPESDRTQAALEWAATSAGHGSPATLAQVMAIRLKNGDLDLVKTKLFSAAPLTAEDVQAIHRVLHMMMTPMCVANISHAKDGLVVHVRQNLDDDGIWSETKSIVVSSAVAAADGAARITSTAFRWDGTAISSLQSGLPSKLLDCLRLADGQKHILRTPCGAGDDACHYVRSLKIYLHGMIHNLYVQALKLLHAPSGSLMRSILMAGHCYGPCDPLSNIILNSIWHETCGSVLSSADRMVLNEYNDVLDPLSLLRLVVRSLEGLVNLALSVDPRSSIARALEKLCGAKCAVLVGDMLSPATTTTTTERSEKNPFHEAAMAARHPLPLELGEFHRMLLLEPDGRRELLSHITKAQTGGGVLCVDDMRALMSALWFKSKTSGTVQAPAPAPELCVDEAALRAVSSGRSQYEGRGDGCVQRLKRCSRGPKYEVDFILGVEKRGGGRPRFCDTRHRINFMATSDENVPGTLFYAELWSWPLREPRTDLCCPLPYAYAGRCYYDKIVARKMVYPDDAKYIPGDITSKGTGDVDGVLEMDLVHFSPELDVELARKYSQDVLAMDL
ncbi:hypothetical protein ZWY2020_054118 [Hordeum vulgare]|nr:hypothetical protein ZWY2020_054118 [Hordeum vulgare]